MLECLAALEHPDDLRRHVLGRADEDRTARRGRLRRGRRQPDGGQAEVAELDVAYSE